MNRSRANGEKWQDLELRLAPSFLLKERALGFVRPPPEYVTIGDDDDEEEAEQAYARTSSREVYEHGLIPWFFEF